MFLLCINDSRSYARNLIERVIKVNGREEDPRLIPDPHLLEGETRSSLNFKVVENGRQSWDLWLPNDPRDVRDDIRYILPPDDCIQRIDQRFASAIPPQDISGRFCASGGHLWKDIDVDRYSDRLLIMLESVRMQHPDEYCAMILIDINPTEGATSARQAQGKMLGDILYNKLTTNFNELMSKTQIWIHSSLTPLQIYSKTRTLDDCLVELDRRRPGHAGPPFLSESPQYNDNRPFAGVLRKWFSLQATA